MKTKYNSIIKTIILFLIGGTVYIAIEIFSRGYSHYSMFIAGGLSLSLINSICNRNKSIKNKNILFKAFIGGLIITLIEFITGLFLNVILKMSIWDYSSMPFNILGQICLPFTLFWILLSFPALFVCKIVDNEKEN